MINHVIIVGAGASGMMAAIVAARRGKKVLIIDRMVKAGKKIYATGNGKCNFTNTKYDYDSYRGNNTDIVAQVLKEFSYEETIDFFEELGILAMNRDGYIYPYSEQASSIVEVMLMELDNLGVKILLEENVEKITKDKEYIVYTDKGVHKASKVILATGGKASPKLGSDGSGYRLAKGFGHNIITPVEALVQLKSKPKEFKTISGVRIKANITMNIQGEESRKNFGEVVFTDYGISGIPIMQLSRYAARALLNNKKVRLEIDFYPDMEDKELLVMLKHRQRKCAYKDNYQLLIGMINSKLAGFIEKKSNGRIETMIKYMKHMPIEILGTNTWDNAQVSAGGVDTTEIDAFTMESKLNQGLYITGELMDIDGTCGGYNLQWAWATGYIAGKSI